MGKVKNEIAQRRSSEVGGWGGGPPFSGVTGANYAELAIQVVRANGGEGVVIDRRNPAQETQRKAWLAYFGYLDEQTFPRGKKQGAWRQLEKITVPTPWPRDFDANAPGLTIS